MSCVLAGFRISGVDPSDCITKVMHIFSAVAELNLRYRKQVYRMNRARSKQRK
jgi:hypothetical protein